MSTKTTTMHIPFTHEQRQLWQEAKKLRYQAGEIEKKLLSQADGHADIKIANRLTRYPTKPVVEVSESGFSCKWSMNQMVEDIKAEPPKPTTPTRPSLQYMDPKIVNNLLNSKLLSDDEKRKMLAATIPNFDLALAYEDQPVSKDEATQ